MTVSTDAPRPLVLYGAGKYGQVELSIYRDKGVEPVCFCDSDSGIWGTTVMGLKVMSPADAFRAYPRCDVHVAIPPPARFDVSESLLRENRVAPWQLRNYEKVEKYVSCRFLQNVLIADDEGLGFCCSDANVPPLPFVKWGSDLRSTLATATRLRNELIGRSRDAGDKTPCHGCPYFREGHWPIRQGLHEVVYGVTSPCQVACVYCPRMSQPGVRAVPQSVQDRIGKFDFTELLSLLEQEGQLGPDRTVTLASGEITVNPRRDSILDAMAGYRAQIFSNGAIYNEKVSALAQRPGSYICVSLDAGTRDTFHKVKRVDVFDNVVENIRRYRKEGATIRIKYLFIPENSNPGDVDAFMDLVAETGISCVDLSRDVSSDLSVLPNAIRESAVRLGTMARRSGVAVSVLSTFPAEQARTIREAIAAG